MKLNISLVLIASASICLFGEEMVLIRDRQLFSTNQPSPVMPSVSFQASIQTQGEWKKVMTITNWIRVVAQPNSKNTNFIDIWVFSSEEKRN